MDVNVFVSSRHIYWYMTWPRVHLDLDIDLRLNIKLTFWGHPAYHSKRLDERTRWYSYLFSKSATWEVRVGWGNLSLVFGLPFHENFKLTASGKLLFHCRKWCFLSPYQCIVWTSFAFIECDSLIFIPSPTRLTCPYRGVIWVYRVFHLKTEDFAYYCLFRSRNYERTWYPARPHIIEHLHQSQSCTI